MHNRYNSIKKIFPTARLIILLSLIIATLLAKSIYLILLITTFVTFVILFISERVKVYVKYLKKYSLLLLIFFLAYIIILKDKSIINLLLVLYKILLSSIIIKTFELTIEFDELHEAIYGVLLPFKMLDIEKASKDFTIGLYSIKYWFNSNSKVKENFKINSKSILNLNSYISSRIICTINDCNKLDLRLKLTNYSLKYKKMSILSKIIILVFLIFLLICIYREVVM